jgi:NAD-dependent dihydropyrimidine dehydrogenase PreA subunit
MALRAELVAAGYKFRTDHSDTEVLITAMTPGVSRDCCHACRACSPSQSGTMPKSV